jgi:hypothetical protein
MIWHRKERKIENERLDRVSREVLRAVKVSEAEVNAVADSQFLYSRLRSRIEAERRQQDEEAVKARKTIALIFTLLGSPDSLRWAFVVAVVFILLVAGVLYSLRSHSPEQKRAAIESPPPSPLISVPRAPAPLMPLGGGERETAVGRGQRNTASRTSAAIRRRTDEAEIVTEYLPLTYVADSDALESGQVVRVRIPRSALVTLGLPMNFERAGELVKADVVIGDDGLARAIRFVQ